jgi:hypothetical protein
MSHAAHLTDFNKPAREGYVRRPSDWSAGAKISIVNHAPSHVTFRVSLRDDANFDDKLCLTAFRADCISYRGGWPFPSEADLDLLRAEAVLMSLLFAGLVIADEDFPGACGCAAPGLS